MPFGSIFHASSQRDPLGALQCHPVAPPKACQCQSHGASYVFDFNPGAELQPCVPLSLSGSGLLSESSLAKGPPRWGLGTQLAARLLQCLTSVWTATCGPFAYPVPMLWEALSCRSLG